MGRVRGQAQGTAKALKQETKGLLGRQGAIETQAPRETGAEIIGLGIIIQTIGEID